MKVDPKILLIDGNNTLIRNFCVNPISDINGNPAGGVVGTIRSIKSLIRETKATRVFVIWDAPGGSRKRRGVLAEYKAGRKPRLNREVEENTTDSKDNLTWQFSKTKQLLGYLGVTQIEVPDIEADDAIGYVVGLLEPTQKVVVSSDRDMWQLVSSTTSVYWPVKKVFITGETYKEFSPILPENFVLARSLSGKGDPSDNIRGIKGLGDKTILRLFPFLCSVPTSTDELMKFCEDKLKENRWYESILQSKDLIYTNVQLMQLTSPIISANSAGIIRNAVLNVKPKFEFVNFKLALLNSGIQLTDADLGTTFQEYRLRVNNETT